MRWCAVTASLVPLALAALGSRAAAQPVIADPAKVSAGDGAAVPAAMPACDDPAARARLAALLRAHRFADVHHAATTLRVACGDRPSIRPIRALDDIALLRLEDRTWAIADLHDLAAMPHDAATPDVLLAWAYGANHDDAAAAVVRARLPAPRAAALAALGAVDDADAFEAALRQAPAAVQPRARELARAARAHPKHPALAAVLSAIVPGAGQIYSGSFQAAGVTFVLNALFVASTIELTTKHLYGTAVAAGTVGSFFYIGGILNAADLSRRRNQLEAAPSVDELERVLVPELDGAFATP